MLKYDVDKKLFFYIDYTFEDDESTLTQGYKPDNLNSYTFTDEEPFTNITLNYNITNTYPFSCVSRNNYNGGIGTAYLVGPNVLATAAHCLINKDTGVFNNPSVLSETFGQYYSQGNVNNRYINCMKYIYVSSWYIPYCVSSIQSRRDSRFNHDFALAVLRENLGEQYGYLGVERYSNYDISHKLVVDGYKHTRVYQTLSYVEYIDLEFDDLNRCCSMQFSNNVVGGDSGAPMIDYTSNYVVGTVNAICSNYGVGAVYFDYRYFLLKDLIGGIIV